ncbi:MAG: amidophosphoribosyltransferase [Varibaculum sp.]|nr:amidophosphoribosyltransferase [Varibaculum sp.]
MNCGSGNNSIGEECGVFGVWAPGEDVARMTYFGIYALQHRGQQSAGIATADGTNIMVYKDMGLVSQVFNDQVFSSMRGDVAVGHVRYATTGADVWRNAQPALAGTADGALALAHNGNLTNTTQLNQWIAEAELYDRAMANDDTPDAQVVIDTLKRGRRLDAAGTIDEETLPTERQDTDTSLLTELLGHTEYLQNRFQPAVPATTEPETIATSDSTVVTGHGVENTDELFAPPLIDPAKRLLPQLTGAFSLAFMDEQHLYAARDPHGLRPLVLGRLYNGWCVASETASLDLVGAQFVREIDPGELVAIGSDGVKSYRFADPTPHGCVFEYVYVSRPDTRIAGRSVLQARQAMGEALARAYPVDADLVIATPDSGTPAAVGYARASGIPFGVGLVKNSYVGRTFIQPSQTMRKQGIRLKLNPIREVISGRRLVVIDDSIVRGNTQQQVVRMLREAGATEVHVRISSPPVTWPCFFGIDFPTRAELAAANMSVEQVCAAIGADSLGYLSEEDMVAATGQAESALCTACFTGRYPIPIPAGTPVPGTPGAVLMAGVSGE